ncbi:hypothetical protein J2X69_000336 [Algoriphagus sp. 4150]|nr:hypothetical protein [Algoriphagus sp. 4150]
MDIFKGQNIVEFAGRFQSDLHCKKYLSEVKWTSGYTFRKCGHHSSQIRKGFSRTCNKCNDTESPGAYTLFHKVMKFGLLRAFPICFEIEDSTESNGYNHHGNVSPSGRKEIWQNFKALHTAIH